MTEGKNMVNVNAINLKPDSYIYNLLNIGHNFGVEVDNNKSVFGRVKKYIDVPVFANRYGALAARTSSVAYAGGSATAWNTWTNADNFDIFREKETDKILQAHIGIWPMNLRLWKQIPASQARGNLSEIILDEPALIDTPGWIDGSPYGSPYALPSRRTEVIAPREFPVRFMIFNPSREAVMPQFIVHLRRCEVKWYDPDDPKDLEMIKQFSKFLMTNKGEPVHYYSPGIVPFSYGVEQNLNIKGVGIQHDGSVMVGGKVV